jgi:hypothetical protein
MRVAPHCAALLAPGNKPAGIAIDDQVLFRDQEGLLKNRLAEFFERQEPFFCGPEVLLEQAWMRFGGICALHYQPAGGLVAGI